MAPLILLIKTFRQIDGIVNSVHNFLLLKKNRIFIDKYLINGRVFISNRGVCKIEDNLIINSGKHFNPIGDGYITRFIIADNAELFIGNNTGISNSTIYCTKKIEIGSNVLIGGNCKIWDTDFHSINPMDRTQLPDISFKRASIRVCDNVFIGANSIVLKGVSIGKNSVIGAGSVVSKNIPENEVWGGNPIKFIRKL